MKTIQVCRGKRIRAIQQYNLIYIKFEIIITNIHDQQTNLTSKNLKGLFQGKMKRNKSS